MSSRLDWITDWFGLAFKCGYSVARIAVTVGVSRQHVRRYFQDRLGQNPQNLLPTLRLEAALQLLASGSPVKVVASELGFSDSSHFIRFFEHETGESPGQFQKRFRNGNRFCGNVPSRQSSVVVARSNA